MLTPDQQKISNSSRLVSLSQAASQTPYSAEYLGLLARKGKLKAVKIGRDWLTTEQAVKEYTTKQIQKHERMLKKLSSSGEGGTATKTLNYHHE